MICNRTRNLDHIHTFKGFKDGLFLLTYTLYFSTLMAGIIPWNLCTLLFFLWSQVCKILLKAQKGIASIFWLLRNIFIPIKSHLVVIFFIWMRLCTCYYYHLFQTKKDNWSNSIQYSFAIKFLWWKNLSLKYWLDDDLIQLNAYLPAHADAACSSSLYHLCVLIWRGGA